VYEKTNNALLKKLMNDINLIKTGHYIDEGELVSVDNTADIPLKTGATEVSSTTPL
jgi:hypothetical protein